MDGAWIDKAISNSQEIQVQNESERILIEQLIDRSYQISGKTGIHVGKYLAASFDLVVAADYYSAITHTKWLYCPGAAASSSSRLIYHFTNCCPQHVLEEEFVFSPANKPPSGKIGRATSRLLCDFYQRLFVKRGKKERILIGAEPVDVVIVDDARRRVIFAEIKASPLLTPPLTTDVERMYTEKDGERTELSHQITNNTALLEKEIQLLIPVKKETRWTRRYFSLGKIGHEKNLDWAHKGILALLENQEFLISYYDFWFEALRIYSIREQMPIFWLTNACGTPSPIPPHWARRREGKGYESVSDSKTSVGMDRTDDIKKGIYQTLKLGSLGKPVKSDWTFRTALISNIHAARHFEEYLGSLKDVVWTLDNTGKAKKVSDLPLDQDVYNLTDGIVALTSALSHDAWVAKLFSF